MTTPDPQITALEQELRSLQAALLVSPALQQALQVRIDQINAELSALRPAAPAPLIHVGNDAQLGDLQIGDVAAGHIIKTINHFYGATPPSDAAQQLRAYLQAITKECADLRLSRISQRVDGKEQPKTPQQVRLQEVYTSLTTEASRVRRRFDAPLARVQRFLQRLARANRTPDVVRPERVTQARLWYGDTEINQAQERLPAALREPHLTLSDDTPVTLKLYRPELALEAIHDQRLLVLLGEPGGGKSTVMRYLALLIAQQLQGVPVHIPGWTDSILPIPIVVPLAQVAAKLETGGSADAALWQTLGDILDGAVPLRAGLRDHLRAAISQGGVLLLCDGLDELPADDTDQNPRVQIAAALRRLATHSAQVRIVVTSRILPYQAEGNWKLTSADGWATRTLQKLALGQVTTFVQSWYAALVGDEFGFSVEQAQNRAGKLIAQLRESQKSLEPLIESPLLLTMLALLHLNTESVPDDEAQLYEECVKLLLDRWETVRQDPIKRAGMIERLGNPPGLTLALLRGPLHRLAYEALRDARHESSRGLIDAEKLAGVMLKFFTNLQGTMKASDQVATFIQVLKEEVGLLQDQGTNVFAFPHLTFQEYLAACHLASLPTMQQDAYRYWQGADRERWRKTLLLLAARLREDNKAASEGVAWLRLLTAPTLSDTHKKAPAQRRRDALLAALSYQAIGARAAFAALANLEREVLKPLRASCKLLLNTPDPAIQLTDRIAVANVLHTIGDPRYPVSHTEWRRELQRRGTTLTATGEHYWRYVPEGRYWIGEKETAEHDLAQFWIARLPITTAQFAEFVQRGYRNDRHWTEEGLKWREDRREPDHWNAAQYRQPNQPMTIVTWYEATAYCHWLNAQIETELPAGYVLRLPTEAEWEAAAAYAGPDVRRTYPWGDAPEPTLAHAVYNEAKLDAAAPVGCCPAGAAPCGTLDMAGNVWEWCSSPYKQYPAEAHPWTKDFTTDNWDVPLRGGSAWGDSTSVRCGARYWYYPDHWYLDLGFRVCVAPALA
jgi:formylglycine-generating enzyme required for sulfatase activity/energy-coupling factor transporter ATP-binding protein EcfA2